MNSGGEVCNDGTLEPTSFNFNGGTLNNYGEMTLNSLSFNGDVNNMTGAVMNILGSLNINGQGILTNAGDINVAGSVNNNNLITNTGDFITGGNLTNNGGGSIVNSHLMEVSGNMTNNKSYTGSEGSLLSILGNLTNNGGGSMESTGPGYAQISFLGTGTNNGDISGRMDVCNPSVFGNPFPNSNGIDVSNVTYCTNNSPLPVEFLSFTATDVKGDVILNWETASEQNNAYFEVQRMSGNGQFETIGEVAGAGNSQEVLRYQFVDRSTQAGNNLYYRLRQVDYNGEYDFSAVVVVAQQHAAALEVAISPNPVNANSQLNIRLKGEQTQEVPYVLLNMNQQVLQEGTVTSTGVVSTEDLKPGMYLLQIRHSAAPEVLKVVVK